MAGPARVHGLNRLAHRMTRDFKGYCPEHCDCPICKNVHETVPHEEYYYYKQELDQRKEEE